MSVPDKSVRVFVSLRKLILSISYEIWDKVDVSFLTRYQIMHVEKRNKFFFKQNTESFSEVCVQKRVLSFFVTGLEVHWNVRHVRARPRQQRARNSDRGSL